MGFIMFLFCLFQSLFTHDWQSCFQPPKETSDHGINFTVSKSVIDNIFIYYYRGPTLSNYTILKLKNALNLTQQEDFDVNKTTIFFFHGWGENATIGSSAKVASAFLHQNMCNLAIFDYSKLVRSNYNIVNYVISVYNATHIGQAIAEFFDAYTLTKQPINRLKLVGHSIGAQIMAHAVRNCGKKKFERLTGLDAAGPLYNILGIRHLDANDGKFVDVIHTDGGFFGVAGSIGKVDFFPNHGTRPQPGCDEDLLHSFTGCSHRRSYEYYAESIINPKAFLAEKCNRTILFNYCCCNNTEEIYMGYYVNTSAHGNYFLKTNRQSPFGEGHTGVNL